MGGDGKRRKAVASVRSVAAFLTGLLLIVTETPGSRKKTRALGQGVVLTCFATDVSFFCWISIFICPVYCNNLFQRSLSSVGGAYSGSAVERLSPDVVDMESEKMLSKSGPTANPGIALRGGCCCSPARRARLLGQAWLAGVFAGRLTAGSATFGWPIVREG